MKKKPMVKVAGEVFLGFRPSVVNEHRIIVVTSAVRINCRRGGRGDGGGSFGNACRIFIYNFNFRVPLG